MHKDRFKQMLRVSRGLLTCNRHLLDPDHGQALVPRPRLKEECCHQPATRLHGPTAAQVSPPGKGGKPYGKSPKNLRLNMVRLNRTHYSHLKFTSKFFSIFQNCPIKSNSSKLLKFRAIRPHSPRMMRNSHHLLTLYITFQMPDQWQEMP